LQISSEAIEPLPPDIVAITQAQLINAVIAWHRSELAAVCGVRAAWLAYPPTPDDDPAEWAPYWWKVQPCP
jgi:hypothetical protein